MGFKMPLFVGYEDYGPNKNNWMKTMKNNNWMDRMDIYGTHYYPNLRPLSGLKSDLGYAGNIPFWSTEPHWDAKDAVDDWDEAEDAICALWDQVDVGMTGFMWWGYARSGSIRGNLMREFSVPLKDARLIDIDDKDGRSTTTNGKLQTHAFREGNTITVFAVNNNATTSYADYGFGLSKGIIAGDVSYSQYIKANGMSPRTGTATKDGDAKFRMTLPVNSFSIFSFDIDLNSTLAKETVQTKKITAVPSVASNVLRIFGLNQFEHYSIIDITGKVQYKGHETEVDVTGYKPGVYFVKSANGGISRFIKQ